jgi:membrane-associated phospholipid phosphatase
VGRGPGAWLAGGAVIGSYLAVRTGRSDGLDAGIGRWCARGGGPTLDRFVGATTDLGSVHGLVGVTSALAATGRRRAATRVAAGGGLAWTVAQVVKPALPRLRPYEAATATRLVAPPAGSSWPSGHAAVAAAMASGVAPQLPRRHRLVLAGGVAAVGVSRCYVGVHHPSDVLAGLGVGVLAARAARALLGPVTHVGRGTRDR